MSKKHYFSRTYTVLRNKIQNHFLKTLPESQYIRKLEQCKRKIDSTKASIRMSRICVPCSVFIYVDSDYVAYSWRNSLAIPRLNTLKACLVTCDRIKSQAFLDATNSWSLLWELMAFWQGRNILAGLKSLSVSSSTYLLMT